MEKARTLKVQDDGALREVKKAREEVFQSYYTSCALCMLEKNKGMQVNCKQG